MRSFALLKTNTFATIESIHQLEPLVPNPHQRLGVEAWMGEEVATGSVLWRLVPHSRSSPVLRQSSAISNPYLTRDRPRGVLRRSCARPGRGLRSIQQTNKAGVHTHRWEIEGLPHAFGVRRKGRAATYPGVRWRHYRHARIATTCPPHSLRLGARQREHPALEPLHLAHATVRS